VGLEILFNFIANLRYLLKDFEDLREKEDPMGETYHRPYFIIINSEVFAIIDYL